MDSLTANQAKTQFGSMLLKAQREPIQINKNGKPVAVVISVEEYENLEALKLKNIQDRAAQAQQDIENNDVIDGDTFFSELASGIYD